MTSIYQIQTEIKVQLKQANIKTRELAYAIGESPMTTSGRLNGYLMFETRHREIALKLINDSELAALESQDG